MPGIVGLISRRPANECEALVKVMLSAMDHESFYVSGISCAPQLGVYGGWMAHKDSFAAGQNSHKPEVDFSLLFAGEFFGSDRDVIKLYEQQGTDCFRKLNGLFAGLLIDKKQGKALLFNDRYCMERIYWHETSDAIFFASEAKALLRVLPESRAFDEQGVSEFLTYGCTLESRTMFRGIQRLPGASLVTFHGEKCDKRRYFSPSEWESQSPLSVEGFESAFEETFKRVLPKYFESETKIGISLTGGLDTRMIMACRPRTTGKPTCYTFSGECGETLDDRLAGRVAAICGLEHRLLRLGSDFLSDFGSHTDRTVYLTDGCFGATGAHEIYFNKRARAVAPVRLTGNYGSEVLRGVSTFKPLGLSPSLINSDAVRPLRSLERLSANGSVHPISFAAFYEIPWNLFASLSAARSQVRVRTPYLDNELVALAYRAPQSLRKSPLPAWRLIKANNPLLSKIPTDRRPPPDSFRPAAILRRFISEATFKLDYFSNEGWPNPFSSFDPIFGQITSALKIAGLHKYLHYRSWFRNQLASYVKGVLCDPKTQQAPFWNRRFLEEMVMDHIKGRANYLREINAVITLEAVGRLLLRSSAHIKMEPTALSSSPALIAAAG
jgi:asparagine synthase (glutamine-hydrolysing)